MKDKIIIVLEDATEYELAKFKEQFNSMNKQQDNSPILTNAKCKFFKYKKGEMFEIVQKEIKVKDFKLNGGKK